jgi:hypothetical protein
MKAHNHFSRHLRARLRLSAVIVDVTLALLIHLMLLLF